MQQIQRVLTDGSKFFLRSALKLQITQLCWFSSMSSRDREGAGRNMNLLLQGAAILGTKVLDQLEIAGVG